MSAHKLFASLLLSFLFAPSLFAVGPKDLLIIANKDLPESVKLAEYYCAKRTVPTKNILSLSLGANLNDYVSRADYEQKLALPIRKELTRRQLTRPIRCLLLTYGVPFKVGGRGPLKGEKKNSERFLKERDWLEQELEAIKNKHLPKTSSQVRTTEARLRVVRSQIGRVDGKETSASVDSELSMVLFGQYELYRWQRNRLKDKSLYWDFRTLMVCRLDGPGVEIARGLVDKSMAAEAKGLSGFAYIDSGFSQTTPESPQRQQFDRCLKDLVVMIKTQTQIAAIEEPSAGVFPPGICPATVIYCGWYSLQKYVDAFEYVDGAIGYHIASLEAVHLRDPNSTEWCPAMLKDGITATIGAVAEPYLHTFPKPDEFFAELFNGYCLVEAYYRSKPFNSWQMVLIGDPLYTPFRKR